ncbi:MAG: MATE family efflux transporter [Bacteroidales bacterium]|nr:MATE family efflux transporter [Bacteroidales bacterium]
MKSLNREILRLAIPSILANITIPLVGMVDVAIIGHISNASAIGGIAIGTMLFDLLYWNFGFLRIGTSGLTAQAFGQANPTKQVSIFAQTMSIAAVSALFVLAIQWLFVTGALYFVPCSEEVADFARRYFFVRIWAAPATLALMVFKGWFIGMQDTVSPMVCDIVVNVVNMVASYLLAVQTPLGIIGVAYGTVIAQYVGLFTAIGLLIVRYGDLFHEHGRDIVLRDDLGRVFRLSGNLFVRSLCFMVVYVGFTVFATTYGDGELAVSTIMMKLFMLFSYFVDGFAYAGEALTGRFIGEGSGRQLRRAVRLLFVWALGVGLLFTFIYAATGDWSIRVMTSDPMVIATSHPYLIWLALMPLVSCAAFMWDGIYIGATAGRQVRDCMIVSAVAFMAVYLAFRSLWGIQALYAAYFAHLLARAAYLSALWPKVFRKQKLVEEDANAEKIA